MTPAQLFLIFKDTKGFKEVRKIAKMTYHFTRNVDAINFTAYTLLPFGPISFIFMQFFLGGGVGN